MKVDISYTYEKKEAHDMILKQHEAVVGKAPEGLEWKIGHDYGDFVIEAVKVCEPVKQEGKE